MEVELAQPVKRGMNIPFFASRERRSDPRGSQAPDRERNNAAGASGLFACIALILKKLASIGMGELCCIR